MSQTLIKPFRVIAEFMRLETSAGIILFIFALLALFVANSPWADYYQGWFHLPQTVSIGHWRWTLPGVFWINDLLMTLFFLLIGLEIKREICIGELNSFGKISLPAFAALGGMLVPALLYVALNYQDSLAVGGWAIPTATDIAFALGIVALLGKRVPVALKLFLMALAVFDDLGAIIIIAIFYQTNFFWPAFIALLLCLGGLVALNRCRVYSLWPYGVIGIALWGCCLAAGIHPTIAGVLLGLTIPLQDKSTPLIQRPPLQQLEHQLHPIVAYAILPLFSFANAGVSFQNISSGELFSAVPLGIFLGLFVGKQLGVLLFSWLAIHLGWATLPKGGKWFGLYGIALICGVGFTMSLFIGDLAFNNLTETAEKLPSLVRFGVLGGSLLSGMMGYILLSLAYPSKKVQPKVKLSKT